MCTHTFLQANGKTPGTHFWNKVNELREALTEVYALPQPVQQMWVHGFTGRTENAVEIWSSTIFIGDGNRTCAIITIEFPSTGGFPAPRFIGIHDFNNREPSKLDPIKEALRRAGIWC